MRKAHYISAVGRTISSIAVTKHSRVAGAEELDEFEIRFMDGSKLVLTATYYIIPEEPCMVAEFISAQA